MQRLKRSLCCVLAMAILLPCLSVSVAHAAGTSAYNGISYSTDYTNWRQADPAWGEHPLGNYYTLASSGCLVSAISMLMCHSKAYDPAYLNPGSLLDWLDQKGYVTHSANRDQDGLLSYGSMTKSTSPRFYFVNQEHFSTSTPLSEVCSRIRSHQSQGYQVVARVKNSGHFVAVANCSSSDAQLFDSGYRYKKLLSEYQGTIGGLLYFKADLNGKDTILNSLPKPPKPPEPPEPDPNPNRPDVPLFYNLARTYGDGDQITTAWRSCARATHYNVYVEVKENDTWKADYKTFFYAVSPFTIDPLPAGEYRIKVQATNSADWSYADSDYQVFTVRPNSLTISYNATGGTVFPRNQLVANDSIYDLPTPQMDGAAFLGWYTDSGTMVNRKTKVQGPKGHTLTARWTDEGLTMVKKKRYELNFQDISPEDWYYDNVAASYSYGLINGISETQFAPKKNITAAQTITLGARLHKLFHTGNEIFPKTTPWSKAYVDYAISHDMLDAPPEDPNAIFTRQEFAAFIDRSLPLSALPAINSITTGAIPDVYPSDEAIYRLYRAGILSGRDEQGSFRPEAPITRAEVAVILIRLADPNERVLFSLY